MVVFLIEIGGVYMKFLNVLCVILLIMTTSLVPLVSMGKIPIEYLWGMAGALVVTVVTNIISFTLTIRS
jgi:hypothetical protein